MIYQRLLKPLLFTLDAEIAHEKAISFAAKTSDSRFLKTLASALYKEDHPGLEQQLFGCTFPNPIGLAAGFDKNGIALHAMQALGFGFVEIGSITAKPSAGNARPRAFRLPKDQALINRMGLNNEGADVICDRLEQSKPDIPVGVNIAKTNDVSIRGDAALQDYLYSYEKAQNAADYITVNISCPNTGEGKTFEDPGALRDLLALLNPAKENRKPSLVKFTVDIERADLEKLIYICEDFEIAGYVATNTSSSREGLQTSTSVLEKIGNGGLSGRAIQQKSTQVVRWINEITDGNKPIIGVGGIRDTKSALEKLDAGASLLQIYTGLIYEGPGLAARIKKGLKKRRSI